MVGGQPIFEIAPQTLNRIEFGGVRRKEEQPNIGGKPQGAGFVKGPIIEQEEMEVGGIGGSEVIEEELKAVRIERGQFQKEALPCERRDRAV